MCFAEFAVPSRIIAQERGELGATLVQSWGKQLGSVFIDYSGFIPATMESNDIIIGVTDGDASVGPDVDLSNGAGTGLSSSFTYISPVGASVGELIPANTALPFSNITFQYAAGVWTVF